MESGIWSGKKKLKGESEVTALIDNEIERVKQPSGCCRRSSILLFVVAGLLASFGLFQLGEEVDRRETKMPTVSIDHETVSPIRKHDYGNFENSTDANGLTGSEKQCRDVGKPRTFPNLDYSLLGYNILKGYPLSIGHDPGFTLPIFAADYSSGLRTADCRYKVPNGLMIIPDVACEISFSSKIAKTEFQMARALSVSLNFGGGGWGVEFSASNEFKISMDEMRSGEYVFIVSTATCGNYYNDLLMKPPPSLHPMFSDWVNRLGATSDKKIYFEFFDTFGTHFAKNVFYGARYSYEYKMKWDAYKKNENMGLNIAREASYSGIFSVSGGFGMTLDQKKAAASFSKSVESKLITTGALPDSKGGANAWMAAVKENPLPITYDLVSIENLFTPAFMPGQDKRKIKKIAARISKLKFDYCLWLRMKGKLNSCSALKPGIELIHTVMRGSYGNIPGASFTECVESCNDDSRCLAINFCIKCSHSCYKFGPYAGKPFSALVDPAWKTVIFYEKIDRIFSFQNSKIKGMPRTLMKKSDRQTSQSRCLKLCLKDVECSAISYIKRQFRTSKCLLYGADFIIGMSKDPRALTKFVPWRQRARALLDLTEHNATALKIYKN